MRCAAARLSALFLLAGLLGLLTAGSARADDAPPTAGLGLQVDLAALQSAFGKSFDVAGLDGKKAVVVVFLSFDCPVAASYAEPLTELVKAYRDKGVALVGVSVNTEESDADLAKHVTEFGLTFPVCRDARHAVADAFRAEFTPEAFVLDAARVMRYRGRIDNGYSARLRKSRETTRHDLKLALDDVLAGRPVSEPATRAIGCPIPRLTAAPVAAAKVTYHRDVLPILQNHCQVCHRPGEVGPFSLLTYRQAVQWADDIKDFAASRKMPPWKPVDGPAFHHERRLSEREIATLAAWVDDGTPEGDPRDAPPARIFPAGWMLGEPDLVLSMSDDFHLGATGRDLFRCFVLPTNLPEDRYVTAVAVRPGNTRVVHHALLFIDTEGQARRLEQKERDRAKGGTEADHGPGYTSAMGVGFRPSGTLSGWAPGHVPHPLPEGTGYYLPKGADVVLQLHYHRDGRGEKDRTQIGLYFAKKPVAKRYQGITLAARFLFIPPGSANYKVEGSAWVMQDCALHSVMPHMHMLGKEIQVTLTPPDGPARTLVAIKDWDYNWQETYFFQEPIHVKAGTKLTLSAAFDNSAANPNNPNAPPRIVWPGEQTTNEMCFGFVGATSDQPGRIRVVRQAPEGAK